MVCWLSACTCCPPPRAARRRQFAVLPAAPGGWLSGLLFREIEARLQQRQPLFDAQAALTP
jgi:hypothetical protein